MLFIFELVWYVTIGPALGLLFLSHASQIEKTTRNQIKIQKMYESEYQNELKEKNNNLTTSNNKQNNEDSNKTDKETNVAKERKPVDLSVWNRLK